MNREITSKISATQLVAMLVVSRSFALLTRPAAFCSDVGARETVIGLCISVLFICALDSKPVAALFKRIEANILTKIMAAALCLTAAVKALLSLVVFFQMESENIFSAFPIILLIVLVVYYALSTGVEGIARFAFIVAAIFTVILVFTVIADSSRMDLANLAVPLSDGGHSILNIVLANTLLCPEIAAYFVLRRFVRKEDAHKRTFRSFYCMQALIIGLFTVAQELVFGSFTQYQNYPVYALAVVGEFSIFQRLDVIHLGLWILISIVKLCTLLIAASALLADVLPRVGHTACNIAVSVLAVFGAFLLMSVFVSNPEVVEGIMIGLFAAALFLLLCTAVCGLASKLKKGKNIV